MPQVSIITPIFADTMPKVDWLKETLESVRDQSFTDFEVVIIDDCSPFPVDGLRDWFDERFRWFKTAGNQGPSTVRNTAVALARGDAILPLDADDLLAEKNSLEILYSAWKENPDLVVYGDLQRLEAMPEGGFRRAKVIKLADYEFRQALNLNGLLPVTTMHSKECHVKAGGWKPELDSGMEDVEYWIAAGKAGYCGKHVPVVTLLYRWHEKSRSYSVRHVLRREGEMRERIRNLHEDVYSGRYPMGCCGGSGRSQAGTTARQANPSRVTTLDQYSTTDKVWVQYKGNREGSWGVVGQYTGIAYQIMGQGHKLEVHVNDLSRFKRAGRGKFFDIGVAAPPGREEPVQARPSEEPRYEPPAPRLAEIERLDEIAEAPPGLEILGLGTVQTQLERAGWTLEKLAGAEINELTPIKGIGAVRAASIINRAKEHAGG